MVVVEPVVHEEKIRQLLAEQAESESLDYKEVVDLSLTRDKIELVKDIGAMQILGGFIVVGADSQGSLTGRLTREQAQAFDEANIRQIVERYLPEPLDLLAAVHEIEGHPVAVVYSGPHRDCFAIFRADGQYDSGSRPVSVFRRGDVFARHGSRSERWRQDDVDRIRRCLVSNQKEEWRREFAADLERVTQGTVAQHLAAGPADAVSWRVDSSTFVATLIELLRAEDHIPIRLLLDRLPVDAAAVLAGEGDSSDFATVADRTAAIGAVALRLDQWWLVAATTESLRQLYLLGHREARSSVLSAPQIWLTVLLRVYALGALAVRRSAWAAVRELSIQRPEPDTRSRPFYRSWIRHGLTMAARSQLFAGEEDGRRIELSLLSLALDVIRDDQALHPDLPSDDERLLDSLCQFDALASLTAIDDAGATDSSVFYTSFARFYTHRTEPVLVRVLTDPSARAALFRGSDQRLADALREMNRRAQSEAFRYAGWNGFDDERIVAFLSENPPT